MSERICRYLLALAAVFCLAGQTRAEERIYVNGFDSNFPPFAYVNDRGKPDGFDIRAIEWIAREMRFSVRHEPTEWDSVVACLKEKGIDLVASGMSITPELKERVSFTIPYWSIRKVIITGKNSNLTADQIMGRGRRLAVLRGTSEAEWIEQNIVEKAGKKPVLVYYDSAAAAIEGLLGGRVAGLAVSDFTARDAMKEKPVRMVGGFGMPDEQFGYAVRKDDGALLGMLNAGLIRLMGSPYWKELQRKYIE